MKEFGGVPLVISAVIEIRTVRSVSQRFIALKGTQVFKPCRKFDKKPNIAISDLLITRFYCSKFVHVLSL